MHSQALESSRNTWCNLLGDETKAPVEAEAISDIITSILEPSPPKETPFKNRDHIDQAVDQKLAVLFRTAFDKACAATSLGARRS